MDYYNDDDLIIINEPCLEPIEIPGLGGLIDECMRGD